MIRYRLPLSGWAALLLAAFTALPWVPPAQAAGPGEAAGAVRIAVAPVAGAPRGAMGGLMEELDRSLGGAHFLSGRLYLTRLDHPYAASGEPDGVPPELDAAAGDADLLIWGAPGPDGALILYAAHRYARAPDHQSRQAAGDRPIVPLVHRLPDYRPHAPLKTAYAVLGAVYVRLGRYDAALQVLEALNNYPDLSPPERYPVVFFIALSELVAGTGRGNPELVDRALYHFGALLSVAGDHPRLAGPVLVNRGVALQLHPTRRGPSVLQQAVASYEAALPHYPARQTPVLHARILHQIASAEQRMPPDRDGYHLHRAIMAYRRALRIWTPEAFPEAYRSALHNMALCLQRLPVGDRTRNIQSAISLYQQLLKLPLVRQRPDLLAATFGNLGQAYAELPVDPEGRSLLAAIAAFREALRYWVPERDPRQFARLHQLSGQAFQRLPVGDRRENLLRAARHFDLALSATDRGQAPMDYALIQIKRGVVFSLMPPPRQRHSLELAAAAFEDALTIVTPDSLPYFHAKVVKNLETVRERLARLTGKGPEEGDPAAP